MFFFSCFVEPRDLPVPPHSFPPLPSSGLIGETSLTSAGLWEEVKDRLPQPGTGLSGGQQQRLCIARAIAVSPELILMDEPCSALDPIATARVEELMDELRANRSEEHTSELQSLMRISYAVFCLKKKNTIMTIKPNVAYTHHYH